MKKTVSLLLAIVLLLSSSFAYIPTPEDQERIEKINHKLEELIDGDKEILRNFYVQLLDIQDYFQNNPRLHHMA